MNNNYINDILINGSVEDQKKLIEELRKEVATMETEAANRKAEAERKAAEEEQIREAVNKAADRMEQLLATVDKSVKPINKLTFTEWIEAKETGQIEEPIRTIREVNYTEALEMGLI